MLPPKRLGDPPTLVFAVVFPVHTTPASEGGLRDLGELRCISGVAAGDPAVTAHGILRDGSRIDLPVSFVRTVAHDLAVASGPTGLVLAPNPTTGSMDVRYRVRAHGAVDVGVFDLGGRKIRSLFSGVQEAGERALRWDGRDSQQRPVPLGVYLLEVRNGGQTTTQRFVLIR